jgi:primosomal protein N'
MTPLELSIQEERRRSNEAVMQEWRLQDEEKKRRAEEARKAADAERRISLAAMDEADFKQHMGQKALESNIKTAAQVSQNLAQAEVARAERENELNQLGDRIGDRLADRLIPALLAAIQANKTE